MPDLNLDNSQAPVDTSIPAALPIDPVVAIAPVLPEEPVVTEESSDSLWDLTPNKPAVMYNEYTEAEAGKIYDALDSVITDPIGLPQFSPLNFNTEEFAAGMETWKDFRKQELRNKSPEVYDKISAYADKKIDEVAANHLYNETSPDSSAIVDSLSRFARGAGDLPNQVGKGVTIGLGHVIEQAAPVVEFFGGDPEANIQFGQKLRNEARRRSEAYNTNAGNILPIDKARDNTMLANVSEETGTAIALMTSGGGMFVPYFISMLDEAGSQAADEVFKLTGSEEKASAAYNDTVVTSGPMSALNMYLLGKISKILRTKKAIPKSLQKTLAKYPVVKTSATAGVSEAVEENWQTASQAASVERQVEGGDAVDLLTNAVSKMTDAASLEAGATGGIVSTLATVATGGLIKSGDFVNSRIGLTADKNSRDVKAKLSTDPDPSEVADAQLYDPFGSVKDIDLLQQQIDKVDSEISLATEQTDVANLTKLRNSYALQKVKLNAALMANNPELVGAERADAGNKFVADQIVGLKKDQQNATTDDLKAAYGEAIADLQDFYDVSTRQGKIAPEGSAELSPENIAQAESIRLSLTDLEAEISDAEKAYDEMLTESFNNELRIQKLGSSDTTTTLANLTQQQKRYDKAIFKIRANLRLNKYSPKVEQNILARLNDLQGRKDLVTSEKSGVQGDPSLAAELQTLRDRQKDLTSKGSLKTPRGILPSLMDNIEIMKEERTAQKVLLDKVTNTKKNGEVEKAFTRIYTGKGTTRFSKSLNTKSRNFLAGVLTSMQSVGDLNVVTMEDFNNPEISKALGITPSQISKAKGKARGYYIPEKKTLVFDKDVSFGNTKDGKLSRDATTLGHEVFHAIVDQRYEADPERFEQAYDDFLKYVQQQGGDQEISVMLAQYFALEPSRTATGNLAPKTAKVRKADLVTDEGVAREPKDFGGASATAAGKRSITRVEFLTQGLNKSWQSSLPETSTGRIFNEVANDIKKVWAAVAHSHQRAIPLSEGLVDFKNSLLKTGGVLFESNLFKNLEELQSENDETVKAEEEAEIEAERVKNSSTNADNATDNIFNTQPLKDVEEFLTEPEKKILRDKLEGESDLITDLEGEDLDGFSEEDVSRNKIPLGERTPADNADFATIDSIFNDGRDKKDAITLSQYFYRLTGRKDVNKSIKKKVNLKENAVYQVQEWDDRADQITDYVQEVGIENAFKGFVDNNSGIPLDARAALGDVLAQVYSAMANITRRHNQPIVTKRLEAKAFIAISRTREAISAFGRGLNLSKALNGYDTFDGIVDHVRDILEAQAKARGATGFKLSKELLNEIGGYAEVFLNAGKNGVPAVQDYALDAINDIIAKDAAINWPDLYTSVVISTQLSSISTSVANNFIPNKIQLALDALALPVLVSPEFIKLALDGLEAGVKLGANNFVSQLTKGDVDLDQQVVNFETGGRATDNLKSLQNKVIELAMKPNKTKEELAYLASLGSASYYSRGMNLLGNVFLSVDDVFTRSVVNSFYIYGITAQEINKSVKEAQKASGEPVKGLTGPDLRSRVLQRLHGTKIVDGEIVFKTFEDVLFDARESVRNTLGDKDFDNLSKSEQRRLALKTVAVNTINAATLEARTASAAVAKETTLTNAPTGLLGAMSAGISQLVKSRKSDSTTKAAARAALKVTAFPLNRSITNSVLMESKWIPGLSAVLAFQKTKTNFEQKGDRVIATEVPISTLERQKQFMRAALSTGGSAMAIATVVDEWEKPIEEKSVWINGDMDKLSPKQLASLPEELRHSNSIIIFGNSFSYQNSPILQGLFRIPANFLTSAYYGVENSGGIFNAPNIKAKGSEVAGMKPLATAKFSQLSRAQQKEKMVNGDLIPEMIQSAFNTSLVRYSETVLGGVEDIASVLGVGERTAVNTAFAAMSKLVTFPLQAPILNEVNSVLGVPKTKVTGSYLSDERDPGVLNQSIATAEILRSLPWLDKVVQQVDGKERVFPALNTFGHEIKTPYFWEKGIYRDIEEAPPEFKFLERNQLMIAHNDNKYDVTLPDKVLDYDDAQGLLDIKKEREKEIGRKAYGVFNYAETFDLVKNYIGPAKEEVVRKYMDAGIDIVRGSREQFEAVAEENSIPGYIVQEQLDKDIAEVTALMRLKHISDMHPEYDLFDKQDQKTLESFQNRDLMSILKQKNLTAEREGK